MPSIGPVATRADMLAFKTKVDILVVRASALLSQRVGKTQLLARLKTDDFGWRLGLNDDQPGHLCAEFTPGRVDAGPIAKRE